MPARPHEVSVSCPCCEENHIVPESLAEKEEAIPCQTCLDSVEYLLKKVELLKMADSAEDVSKMAETSDYHLKAAYFENLAKRLKKMYPFCEGLDDWFSGDIPQTRESLEEAISNYEGDLDE